MSIIKALFNIKPFDVKLHIIIFSVHAYIATFLSHMTRINISNIFARVEIKQGVKNVMSCTLCVFAFGHVSAVRHLCVFVTLIWILCHFATNRT